MLGTIELEKPRAIEELAPRRYSVEPGDVGYLPWKQLMSMGLCVDVRFNGTKIDLVITADERGMIKKYVEDDHGDVVVGSDRDLLVETKSGHVICLVYRPR